MYIKFSKFGKFTCVTKIIVSVIPHVNKISNGSSGSKPTLNVIYVHFRENPTSPIQAKPDLFLDQL